MCKSKRCEPDSNEPASGRKEWPPKGSTRLLVARTVHSVGSCVFVIIVAQTDKWFSCAQNDRFVFSFLHVLVC